MRVHIFLKKSAVTFFLTVAAIVFFSAGSVHAADALLFSNLQNRLIADGFPPEVIHKLYSQPQVFFDNRSVAAFFVHNEARLDYGQFTEPAAIKRAKKYLHKYRHTLARVQRKYGVSKEIITAILLVESQLGKYMGQSVVINTLSTMAILNQPLARDEIWQNIPEDRRISRKEFNEKVKYRTHWAYVELKALIRYGIKQKVDIVSIQGSYAGALGLPQFMPSNILRLGKDGDRDGRIDLFDNADAIASVANFLKKYGWKRGIHRSKAYKILLHYNNSSYYANTILDVAKHLKG